MQYRRLIPWIMAISMMSAYAYNSANASNICAALLAQGIRDTSSQQITEARFNEIKSNVCNSHYNTYSKATSQAMQGGFDLPGLFGISGQSAAANSEYSKKWSDFCQANYGRAMANSDLKSYFSTANQAVLHSFDNCVEMTSERFIRYVQPQPDGKTFAIIFDNKRQGDATFTIDNISLTVSGGKQMNVQDKCDFHHPFPWSTKPLNSIAIVCHKNPKDAVVVNAETTAGNIVPVTVPAVPSPGPSATDRIADLEGVTQSLSQSTNKLNAKLTSDIKSVRKAFADTLQSRIKRLKHGKDLKASGGNSATAECPPDSFLVAVRYQIDRGGTHGITSWLFPVCRTFP